VVRLGGPRVGGGAGGDGAASTAESGLRAAQRGSTHRAASFGGGARGGGARGGGRGGQVRGPAFNQHPQHPATPQRSQPGEGWALAAGPHLCARPGFRAAAAPWHSAPRGPAAVQPGPPSAGPGPPRRSAAWAAPGWVQGESGGASRRGQGGPAGGVKRGKLEEPGEASRRSQGGEPAE